MRKIGVGIAIVIMKSQPTSTEGVKNNHNDSYWNWGDCNDEN